MLSPYRVLDLSDERGLFCSRILAELGADVVHVEPPAGSHARHTGPHAGSAPDPERSLTWWAMAKGTRSVALDLDDAEDRHHFFDLVRAADILIESADPGTWETRGIGYTDLATINPRLVWVSITAFGSTGPKAHYAATDLTVQASSGAMAITGERDRAPLRAAIVPAWTHAAAEAAGGALIGGDGSVVGLLSSALLRDSGVALPAVSSISRTSLRAIVSSKPGVKSPAASSLPRPPITSIGSKKSNSFIESDGETPAPPAI